MSMPTRPVGSVQVGCIGYGAMNLTWKPTQTPDEQAFQVFNKAIDSGCTFINTGEFYSQPVTDELGLRLLSRWIQAEPERAKKAFISVKGAMDMQKFAPTCDLEGMRKSVLNINKLLGGRKMDLFEPARRDPNIPVKQMMKDLMTLRDEGHFKYIGLSECSAQTIREAAEVGPVAAVEVEYSPWSLDIEQNGVLATCKELNVPIIAYSPLGKGFLTGSIKSRADIPEGDHRLTFDRFSEENFPKNLELVEKLKDLAEKKGVTPTQLALSWLLAQWEGIIPIPGSTRVEGVEEGVKAVEVKLSQDDLQQIRKVLDSFKVTGGRYNKHAEKLLEA